jgi:hypothetical protein
MPRTVVTIWAPVFFTGMMCLLLAHVSPIWWLFAAPALALVVFMTTLAEVRDEGKRVLVKSLWKSTFIPKDDVVGTSESFLEGIGVLRLRQFVPPWGRIYFVHEWSTAPVERKTAAFWDLLAPTALALSGFAVARAVGTHGFRIENRPGHIVGISSSIILCLLFVLIRRKMPSLANGLLFVGAMVVGLLR